MNIYIFNLIINLAGFVGVGGCLTNVSEARCFICVNLNESISSVMQRSVVDLETTILVSVALKVKSYCSLTSSKDPFCDLPA